MAASTSGLVPVPRLTAEQSHVPFRLPWQRTRAACRPVIGDTLLLQYTLQRRSIRCMPELTVRQAREMLAAWTADRRSVEGKRDEVIQAAVEAGLSKSEVHRLTGIARTTIDRIVGTSAAVEEGSQ
jgi:hypothetical protein